MDKTVNTKPKLLSLFSGVGGFDLGLENAGMETVFQCEWDKHAADILHAHWRDVPKWGDISTLTGKHILDCAPIIDVVAWGSPCQDLSVAGKRAGLGGERSGLFHEGIRIIKEIRELTNGKYPRISIWENVAGALSSSNGADFGQVLYEMDEAGACFSEWRMLDAQYFGVPQRRRRVFLVSVFDSSIAQKCPDPLLPVSEGVRWDSAASRPTGEDATRATEQSLGSGSEVANTISASLYHHGTVVNQDANNGHVVVNEPYTVTSFAKYEQGVGTLRSNGGDLAGGSETILVENIVSDENQERVQKAIIMRQREGKPGGGKGPLLSVDKSLTLAANANDQTLFVEEPMLIDGRRIDDVRVYEPPVQTLQARMGTGGNNVPVIGFSHTQGLSAQPSESAWPTLRTQGAGMAVAIPIQDGRDMEKHQNGIGIGEEGAPSYTIDQTGAQAVAYSIREDAKANTFSATELDKANALGALRPSPQSHHAQMFIVENTGDNSVIQYDGYNQKVNEDDVSVTIRIGRDSSDCIAQPQEVVGTLRSGGDGGVPSSRGEHLVIDNQVQEEPLMAVRRLTPLECERLMGWPDEWTRWKSDGSEQSDTHRYKQCGNGVASPVAQWIGETIVRIIGSADQN
jgi:DNA (cytosine-5)-methyltransferase 1